MTITQTGPGIKVQYGKVPCHGVFQHPIYPGSVNGNGSGMWMKTNEDYTESKSLGLSSGSLSPFEPTTLVRYFPEMTMTLGGQPVKDRLVTVDGMRYTVTEETATAVRKLVTE